MVPDRACTSNIFKRFRTTLASLDRFQDVSTCLKSIIVSLCQTSFKRLSMLLPTSRLLALLEPKPQALGRWDFALSFCHILVRFAVHDIHIYEHEMWWREVVTICYLIVLIGLKVSSDASTCNLWPSLQKTAFECPHKPHASGRPTTFVLQTSLLDLVLELTIRSAEILFHVAAITMCHLLASVRLVSQCFTFLVLAVEKSRLHEKIVSFHAMLVDSHREQVLPYICCPHVRQPARLECVWHCDLLVWVHMLSYDAFSSPAFKTYQLLFWGLWNTESCPGGSQKGKVVGIGSLKSEAINCKLQLAAHRAAFVKVGLPMPSPFSTQESGEGYSSDRMDWGLTGLHRTGQHVIILWGTCRKFECRVLVHSEAATCCFGRRSWTGRADPWPGKTISDLTLLLWEGFELCMCIFLFHVGLMIEIKHDKTMYLYMGHTPNDAFKH